MAAGKRSGILVDVRVHDEQLSARQHQDTHAGKDTCTRRQPDDPLDVTQVVRRRADRAADHPVGPVILQEPCRNQGRRFGLRVDNREIPVAPQAQAKRVYAFLDHLRLPHQHGSREPFVDENLRSAQHPLALAFGEHDA